MPLDPEETAKWETLVRETINDTDKNPSYEEDAASIRTFVRTATDFARRGPDHFDFVRDGAQAVLANYLEAVPFHDPMSPGHITAWAQAANLNAQTEALMLKTLRDVQQLTNRQGIQRSIDQALANGELEGVNFDNEVARLRGRTVLSQEALASYTVTKDTNGRGFIERSLERYVQGELEQFGGELGKLGSIIARTQLRDAQTQALKAEVASINDYQKALKRNANARLKLAKAQVRAAKKEIKAETVERLGEIELQALRDQAEVKVQLKGLKQQIKTIKRGGTFGAIALIATSPLAHVDGHEVPAAEKALPSAFSSPFDSGEAAVSVQEHLATLAAETSVDAAAVPTYERGNSWSTPADSTQTVSYAITL